MVGIIIFIAIMAGIIIIGMDTSIHITTLGVSYHRHVICRRRILFRHHRHVYMCRHGRITFRRSSIVSR
jgi:hypothetical protein